MDGVLVETSEAHYQSWIVAFTHFDLSFNRDYFLRYYGMNNESTLRGILGEDTPEHRIRQISEYKEHWFRKHVRDEITLLPGVSKWLNQFRDRGYKQAVASSGPSENIEMIVMATQIKPYFNALVSCAQGPSKPDPWVFQEAATRLHAPMDACIVIEDTPNGILAAKSARMRCIAVCSSNPRNALKGADLIVNDLDHLDTNLFDEIFV